MRVTATTRSTENATGHQTIFGEGGNDFFSMQSGGSVIFSGGGGNDTVGTGSFLVNTDKLNGGDGNDEVDLGAGYAGGFVFKAHTISNVETLFLDLNQSFKLTMADGNVAAGQHMDIDGDLLQKRQYRVYRRQPRDRRHAVHRRRQRQRHAHRRPGRHHLLGRRAGHDVMTAGTGADTFLYFGTAADSSGATYDTIHGFDGLKDGFNLTGTVTGIDASVTSGTLNTSHFDDNLASAIDAAHLAAGHATMFTATHGNLAGHTFPGRRCQRHRGYQAGQDFVIELAGCHQSWKPGGGELHVGQVTVHRNQTRLSPTGRPRTCSGGGRGVTPECASGRARFVTRPAPKPASLCRHRPSLSPESKTGGGGRTSLHPVNWGVSHDHQRHIGQRHAERHVGRRHLQPLAGAVTTRSPGQGGADIFSFGSAFTVADHVDGGTGNDTLKLNGDYSGLDTFEAATLTGVERIAVAAGHNYALHLTDANVAAGATLSVDASALGATDKLTFTDAAESDGSLAITRSARATTRSGAAWSIPASRERRRATTRSTSSAASTSSIRATATTPSRSFAPISSASRFDGGAGNNTIYLNGDFSAGQVVGKGWGTNIADFGMTAGYDYKLSFQDGLIAAGHTLSFFGNALAATNHVSLNASHLTAGNIVLQGRRRQ